MKSGKIFYLIVWLAVMTSSVFHAHGQKPAVKLFDDPRITTWSADFLAGKREQVLQSVEADLRSAKPHPFAPHVWAQMKFYLTGKEADLAGIKDENLKRAIGDLPEILKLYNAGEYRQLLKSFPSNQPEQISDPWALHYLFFAADSECRYDDAFLYATRMARLYPDYFQVGWMISGNLIMKEKIRPKIYALFDGNGELVNTNVGRFIRHELENLPTDGLENEDDLAQVEMWLKQFPNDARALRKKGFTLSRLGKDESAIAIFKKASEAYPFIGGNIIEASTRLLKANIQDKAEELIKNRAALTQPNIKAADEFYDEQMAQALINAGQINQAVQFLETAIKKYPKNGELVSLRSIAAAKQVSETGKTVEVIFYSRRAVELEPDNFSFNEKLVEDLARVGLYNEALSKISDIERKFQRVSQKLFSVASISLGKVLNFEERIELCDRSIKEYPSSAWMHRERALAFAMAGRNDDSISSLIASWQITPPNDWSLRLFANLVLDPAIFENPKEVEEKEKEYQKEYWKAARKLAGVKDDEFVELNREQTKEVEKLVANYAEIYQAAIDNYQKTRITPELQKEIQKRFPEFQTRFGWLKFPRFYKFFSDENLILTKAFLNMKKEPPVQLQSYQINKKSDLSYVPKLRVPLESFDKTGINDFNPDNSYAVSDGMNSSILFWDISSGKVTHKITDSGDANSIHFNKTGTLFVTASSDKTVKLWNAGTRSVFQEIRGFAQIPEYVQFDNKGERLFILTLGYKEETEEDGGEQLQWYQLYCWDITKNTLLWTTKHLFTADWTSGYNQGQPILKISPNDNYLSIRDVHSPYNSVSIYSAKSGYRILGIDEFNHTFTKNNEVISIDPIETVIAISQLPSENQVNINFKAQSLQYREDSLIGLSPDGGMVVVTDSNEKPVLIDIKKNQIIQKWNIEPRLITTDIQWNPDSQMILASFKDKPAESDNENSNSKPKPYKGYTMILSINNASPLRVGEFQSSVVFDEEQWSSEYGNWALKFPEDSFLTDDFVSPKLNGEFSPNGYLYISKGSFWNFKTGQIISRSIGILGEIRQVVLSPDKRFLLPFNNYWNIKDEKGEKVSRGASYGAFDLIEGNMLPNRYLPTFNKARVAIDSQNRLISQEFDPEFPNNDKKEALNNQDVDLTIEEDLIYSETTKYLAQSLTGNTPIQKFGNKYHPYFALSQDGNIVLTLENGVVTAWDLAGELKVLWSIDTGEPIVTAALSSDKQHLATASSVLLSPKLYKGSQKVISLKIWNVKTKQLESTLYQYTAQRIKDGVNGEGVYKITDNTGEEIIEEMWEGGSIFIGSRKTIRMEFSSDGQYLVCSSFVRLRLGKTAETASREGDSFITEVWDLSKSKRLYKLPGVIGSFAFSSDNKYLAGLESRYNSDYKRFVSRIKIWQITDGKLVSDLEDSSGAVDVVLSPDNKNLLVLRNLEDGGNAIEIRDFFNGKKLGTIFVFQDSTWAIIDSEGRYDSSNNGDNPNLYWVVGTDVIQVSQLKQRYYEPKLLAKILGFNKEPLRNVALFSDVKLYPSAELTQPLPESSKTVLNVTNRGGGIGRIEVYVNDSLKEDAIPRSALPKPDQEKFVQEIDLAQFERFMLPDTDNKITVKTYNAEGYLSSRGVDIIYRPKKEKIEPPALWALFVGVSDYQEGGTLQDLKFAAIDAENMAKAFRAASEKFFPGRVNIRTLTTLAQKPEEQPTKANIERVLREFADKEKGAKANDVLMLYFAGHGVSFLKADNTDDFYFLTRDARTGDLKDEEMRKTTALSGEEIALLLGEIAANKKVMILDTCASGRFIEKISESRNVDSSTIRSWDRMKDRQGLWILAGSAANAVSYESSRYGQGVLTYSLLQGMYRDFDKVADKAENNKFELLDVSKLFQYSRDTVPELARGIGGIQKPMIASKKDASSFHIGRLDDNARRLVPYTQEKPVYLRSEFGLQSRPGDPLDLTKRINERLNQEMTRGLEAKLVFWESVPKFAGAYQIAGRYEVNNATGEVKVTVYLFSFAPSGENFKDIDVGKPFVVTGTQSEPDKLAADILAAADKAISSLSKKQEN